jgi:carbamoyltransferase
VVGTDISSRAINYSKFNALLNDVKNVEFKLGDLYDPVKSEKFDLILTNPPFVATSGASKLYRDGGERGDRVLNRILSELPQHLKRNGYCQIITLLSEFDSVSHEESLRRFSLKGAHNTLILTLNEMSPYQLALAQYELYLENYEDYRKRVIQYLDFLQKIGLKKTELSLVTIKHDLSGRFEKRRLYVSINVPFRSIDRIKEYYGQPHLH